MKCRRGVFHKIFVAALAFHFASSLSLAQAPTLAAARKIIQEGDYDKAESMLRSMLVSNAADADAQMALGDILAIEGHRSDSIDHLREAIRLKPDSALAYSILGIALSRFSEIDDAQRAFEKAISLDPNLSEAHVNYALVLAEKNDLAGAANQLSIAIRQLGHTSQAAVSHYLLAKIYQQEEHQDKARAELELALQLQPRYAQAWFLLGMLNQQTLDHAGALAVFQHAAALDPDTSSYQYEIGSEYLALSNPHAAAIHLKQAESRMANDRAVLYKLQRALRQDGHPDEAKRVEAKLREIMTKSFEAGTHSLEAEELNDQGLALEKQGDVLKALGKYLAALELYPEQNGYRLNYALALCRLNRWDEGISEMHEVLRLDASNVEARKALYIAEDRAKAYASGLKPVRP